MILLLRLLPFATALFHGAACVWQIRQPGTYPVLLLFGTLAMPIAASLIAWKRISRAALLEKMTPTFVLHLALAFGLLLTEGRWAQTIVVVLAATSTYLSLELLFLLAHSPSLYPVNSLSHVTLAFVPIAVWYAVSTSSGFMVFIHSARVWHLVITSALGAVLFRATGHPGATRREQILWMGIGILTGAEIGWMGLILPLSMSMQGFIAAFLFTAVLRVRRYLYAPKPPLRLAWSETIGGAALFAVSLVSAKWL